MHGAAKPETRITLNAITLSVGLMSVSLLMFTYAMPAMRMCMILAKRVGLWVGCNLSLMVDSPTRINLGHGILAVKLIGLNLAGDNFI